LPENGVIEAADGAYQEGMYQIKLINGMKVIELDPIRLTLDDPDDLISTPEMGRPWSTSWGHFEAALNDAKRTPMGKGLGHLRKPDLLDRYFLYALGGLLGVGWVIALVVLVVGQLDIGREGPPPISSVISRSVHEA
jgi:hypothetical protein